MSLPLQCGVAIFTPQNSTTRNINTRIVLVILQLNYSSIVPHSTNGRNTYSLIYWGFVLIGNITHIEHKLERLNYSTSGSDYVTMTRCHVTRRLFPRRRSSLRDALSLRSRAASWSRGQRWPTETGTINGSPI